MIRLEQSRREWDDGSRTWLAVDLEGKTWRRVRAHGAAQGAKR